MPVFKGNQSLTNGYQTSDIVAYNIISWLSYGFLEAGGYTLIARNLPTSGYTILQKIKDDRYTDGCVYEGFGPSWVWEQDVVPTDSSLTPPFAVSGIYIDNTFYPSNTSGIYSHTIDYERGRIVFDSPVIGPQVSCEYTMRDIAVYPTDSITWRTITDEYSKTYSSIGTTSPSGMAQTLKNRRVWLPSVFVDMQTRDHTALQLGGGEFANFNVFYHTFSDRPALNKAIVDMINDQEGRTLDLFNINTSPKPYMIDGSIASGAKTYKELSNRNGSYYWRSALIDHSEGRTIDNTQYNIFRGELKHKIILERYGFG